MKKANASNFTFTSILLLLSLTVISSSIPAKTHSLAKLKAAYVYNITKFTRWPSHTLAKNMRLFRMCVYGSDDVVDEIKKLNGRPIATHSLLVTEVKSERDFSQCHALYISATEKRRYRYVLSLTGDRAVLTISDDARFIKQGGLVNLTEKAQRLRFEINHRQLSKVELAMSSKLLKLAILVDE